MGEKGGFYSFGAPPGGAGNRAKGASLFVISPSDLGSTRKPDRSPCFPLYFQYFEIKIFLGREDGTEAKRSASKVVRQSLAGRGGRQNPKLIRYRKPD
jgi:hypothetical protein